MTAVFQQLTGINIIFFYSNTVFSGLGISPLVITVIMGVVNLLASVLGFFLLFRFGRKTLMLHGNMCMCLSLLLLGLMIELKSSTGSALFVFCAVASFECSSGPIAWLYNAEIMEDKAMSIATVFGVWALAII